jgi:hypothetical protein
MEPLIHRHPETSPLAIVSRRRFLQLSAGLGVSFLLPKLAAKASQSRGAERPKSLIVLWMQGGPSQLDTWDPHPNSIHSGPIRAISTSVEGLSISHLLPRMAEQMQHLSVVRSLVSKEGDHARGTYYLQTGYRPDPKLKHPSIGAVLSYLLQDEQLEIPHHVALAQGNSFSAPLGGYLGAQFDAFRVFDPGRNLDNMRAGVDESRQERRLENLDVLTDSFRRGRLQQVDATLHEHVIDEALEMMRSPQLRAFEIDGEPAETLDRYGDTRFGRGCLVARRLVEEGVRAVQVTLDGFDTHANNYEGHQARAAELDPAFAALMQDLRDRDLYDSTAVLCIGEFGRTPQINPLEGRDHWPNGFSCVLGGGGLRSGLVIGTTDPDRQAVDNALEPHDKVEVYDLYATLLQALGVNPADEFYTPIGRPMKWASGTPIGRLLV